jgi:integrase
VKGHTRKRGKSWCFVLDIGRDPVTGKRKQKWVSGFATKKEAEAGLRRALGRLDEGDDPVPAKVTVAELGERWFAHMAAQHKPRPRQRQDYERILRVRVLSRIGRLELLKVRPAHCQSILDVIAEEGRAPRTVANARTAMSSMFAYALRGGLVQVNPVRATTTPTPQAPKLVTPDARQLRELIEAARGTAWEIPVLFAATTGARRGEVLGLKWSRVDLDRARIKIVETLQRVGGELVFTPPKTDRSVREVPLPAFAVERLRAHRTAQVERRLALGAGWVDHDLVCERGDGPPCNPDSFTHGAVRIAKAAGMDGVRLHDLRHGVATMLAKSGTPAYVTSKVLGHSSVHFTADTYTHADEESIDRALAGLEEAFGQ